MRGAEYHRYGVTASTDIALGKRIIPWKETTSGPADEADGHDWEELKAKLDAGGELKLVVVVDGWSFRAGHIPGSINFPSPSCVFRELDLNDQIILHSDNHRLQNIRRSVRCPSDPQIPQGQLLSRRAGRLAGRLRAG